MKTVTVKEKVKSLNKKQLVAVALHFMKQSGVDTDKPTTQDELCGDHEGECGACIKGVWIAC